MSQREDYRKELARYFGDKSLKKTGVDFDTYLKRNGEIACTRFFAEADEIIGTLEKLGFSFADEDDLLAPATKSKKK